MKYFKNNQKGLTLTEVIVATGIFSVLIIVLTGIFVNSLEGQRKAGNFQDIQENAQYIMEKISKEIRMSKIITSSPGGGQSFGSLKLESRKEDGSIVDVKYDFSSDSDSITRKEWDSNIESEPATGEFLNSDNVKIKDLDFFVVNVAGVQPRVTINMTLTDLEEKTELTTQTTISSRTYGPVN